MNGSAHSFDQRKRSRQKVTQKIAGALILTLALRGTMVSAQDTRIEISPFFGYTLSEGINVNPDTVAGIIVDQVNPTNGISYGVMFNVNVNENMQVGFLYDNQESNLELKGRGVLGKTNVADLKVRNYHANPPDRPTPTRLERDARERAPSQGSCGSSRTSGEIPATRCVRISSAVWGRPSTVLATDGVCDRRQHEVLVDLGRRRQVLCEPALRDQPHGALDTDLYQIGLGRHLVLTVLAGRVLAALRPRLCQPAPVRGRRHVRFLDNRSTSAHARRSGGTWARETPDLTSRQARRWAQSLKMRHERVVLKIPQVQNRAM